MCTDKQTNKQTKKRVCAPTCASAHSCVCFILRMEEKGIIYDLIMMCSPSKTFSALIYCSLQACPQALFLYLEPVAFFPHSEMEILNVMAYLMKKILTVTWREEEFHFSIFPFYVCFLSHLFPFILSLISEKREGKPLFGDKVGAIFCPHFQLRD